MGRGLYTDGRLLNLKLYILNYIVIITILLISFSTLIPSDMLKLSKLTFLFNST